MSKGKKTRISWMLRISFNWICSNQRCSRKRNNKRKTKIGSKRSGLKNIIRSSKRIPKSSNNNSTCVTTLSIINLQKLKTKSKWRRPDIWKRDKVYRIKPKHFKIRIPRSMRECKNRRTVRSSSRSLLSNRIKYSNIKNSNCNKTRSKECRSKNLVNLKRLQKP